MKKLIYILLVAIALNSCSEYQKALKSEDVATKYKLGTELFDTGKYAKANRLFGQLTQQFRGKPEAEKLMYMFSRGFYETKDYATAKYQMQRFVDVYPENEKTPEIAFLSAKSYYKLSPVYSKEQAETLTAITKIQEFINRFPDSEYITDANKLIQELNFKLEKKAFEIGKLYNKITDYQSAIKAFENFIFKFPGTSFKEEALFLKLDSAYKFAINSVEWKKEERLKVAISSYKALKKAFAESIYIEQANIMNEEVEKELEKFNTKS